MEPSAPEIGRKCEDAAGKECLAVSGRLAGHKKRTKSTIGKYGGGFGVREQHVIASAQFRLTNNVECPLHGDSLAVRNPCRFEFQIAKLESYAQLGGRSTGRDTQYLVQDGMIDSVGPTRQPIEIF